MTVRPSVGIQQCAYRIPQCRPCGFTTTSTAAAEALVVRGDHISRWTSKGEGPGAGEVVGKEVVGRRWSGVGEGPCRAPFLLAATTTPRTHRASPVISEGHLPPIHCLVDSSSHIRVRTVEGIFPPPSGTEMSSLPLVLLRQPLLGTASVGPTGMRTAPTRTTGKRPAGRGAAGMRTALTVTTAATTLEAIVRVSRRRRRHCHRFSPPPPLKMYIIYL